MNITLKGFAAKFVKWGVLLCSDMAIETPVLTLNDKSEDNDIVKNNYYVSPVFNKKYTNKFKGFRPNLKPGQIILFNSNLLHGSSLNVGDKSRLSMEIRICNNYKFKK